ncbi:MAG: assimilatory sulfite reductase (NADPH) flavoprotein subunit [Gammaproteobacteria bacterium]|nr:assimilatory sulfite reductase (NADPH) flavoprotein subunit [Gammaproteobacteria bacterium]
MATQPLPAVLPADKHRLLVEMTRGLDAQALHWVSGYVAGLAAATAAPVAPVEPEPSTGAPLTILYGSQTGNARRIAEEFARRLRDAGLPVRLVRADAYPVRELKAERLLYVVISTHSTGDVIEPPDDARDFVEFLTGKRAPRLPELRYAVLALGDSSYPDFCGIGRLVDERLAALGGQRIVDRGDADVDIDSIAAPWTVSALDQARALLADAGTPRLATVTPLHRAAPKVSREAPFAAEVLTNQRIVARGSGKDVRHIELLLDGSGLRYEPGDALAVWPVQDPALVATILEELKLPGDAEVECGGERLALSRWLTERRELTALTRPFVAAHAGRGGHAALLELLEPPARQRLGELLGSLQLIDLLRRYPTDWDAVSLVAALRPLAPRSYSIASSQAVVGDEVHLTVAHWNFQSGTEERWGVASHYLAGLSAGDRARVFLEPNERFRLPADGKRDIIMIGPGTGVAPFRAFVQERAATGAAGRNWLFFGNPHRRTDFLYQLEWQQARRRGELARLDVAFSRDQDAKLYVQHRLREHGGDVYDWIQGGAHVYVCGDADRMAVDVHQALLAIAVEHGGHGADAAAAWLDDLRKAGRYARDVY